MGVNLAKSFITHPFSRRGHWGLATIIGSLLFSYALWIGSMAWHGDWYDDPWKYPAKVGSHGALLLMCWAFILSTRFGVIERAFGGLDKVYKAHRYVGEASFFLVLLHPAFLAAHRLTDGLGAYFSFFGQWEDPAIVSGLIALAIFTLLVALSLYYKIAYHRWKRSHDFFGLLLVLIIAHGIWGQGEIVKYPLLAVWYALWCAAGLAAYVYIRLLYRWLGPQFDYTVSSVREIGADMTEIRLRPVGRKLSHQPGQFIYISFDADAVSNEPHPFTVSSSPEEDEIRLSIKELGDWTEDVDEIQEGESARIWGPYGHLSEPLWKRDDDAVVFLSGGIGVTPFLSLVASEALRQREGPVFVVYSSSNESEAVYAEELSRNIGKLRQGTLILHNSDDEGFIDQRWLEARLESLTDKRFFICGPGPMNEAMEKLLLGAGVVPENFFVEDFQIR